MGAFNAEHVVFSHTLVATGALVAGDPVNAAGAKEAVDDDFIGVAISDAAIGEHVPVLSLGVATVVVDSGSSGVAVGDRLNYATNGYDSVGAARGFGVSLDTAVASGQVRMLILGSGFAATGAELTDALTTLTFTAPATPDYAIANLTTSGSYGFVTANEGRTVLSVIANLQTRVGELEARAQARGDIA